MVHMLVNGLLIEAESVMEIHMAIEMKRYEIPKPVQRHVTEPDNEIITDIVREVLKQLKGEE